MYNVEKDFSFFLKIVVDSRTVVRYNTNRTSVLQGGLFMKKLIFTRKKRNFKRFGRRSSNNNLKKGIMSIAALLIISLCINFIPTTVKADTCEPSSYESVQINNGDTLWDIAKEYNTCDISTKDFVDEIKSVNGLTGDYITDGNYILVPVYE